MSSHSLTSFVQMLPYFGSGIYFSVRANFRLTRFINIYLLLLLFWTDCGWELLSVENFHAEKYSKTVQDRHACKLLLIVYIVVVWEMITYYLLHVYWPASMAKHAHSIATTRVPYSSTKGARKVLKRGAVSFKREETRKVAGERRSASTVGQKHVKETQGRACRGGQGVPPGRPGC